MDFPVFVLTLFSDDWLYFNDGDIAWDGEHHRIVGLQVNSTKMDGFMDFVESEFTDFDDIQDVCNYVISFFNVLEQDDGLRVPRSDVARGVRKALPEGDLTGITLANLAACGASFQVKCTDDGYLVIYDTRLGMGIPHFFDLVARMMWDLRSCMRSLNGLPFNVTFMGARNLDADPYFGDVSEPVAGRQENPGTICVQWRPGDPQPDETPSAESHEPVAVEEAEPDPDGADGATDDDARKALVALLQLARLTSALAGRPLPDEVSAEIDRAIEGDTSIDLHALLARVNGDMPDQTSADFSSWTFDAGVRAEGPKFSVAVPDGYQVFKDVKDTAIFTQTRPFVAVPQGVSEENLDTSDRIIYASMGDAGQGDLKEHGLEELYLQSARAVAYVSEASGIQRVPDESLVRARNCTCLVQRIDSGMTSGFEYYIRPLGLDVSDWLRLTFYNCNESSARAALPVVEKLAKTVRLVDPKKSDLELAIDECLTKKVRGSLFVETFNKMLKVVSVCQDTCHKANQHKYMSLTDDPTEEGLATAAIAGLSDFAGRAFRYCELCVSAFETQNGWGIAPKDKAPMVEVLKLAPQLFELQYEVNDDTRSAIHAHGNIKLPTRYAACVKRIDALVPGYLEETKARIAKRGLAFPNE